MPDYEIEVGGKTYDMHSDKALDRAAIQSVVTRFKSQTAATSPAPKASVAREVGEPGADASMRQKVDDYRTKYFSPRFVKPVPAQVAEGLASATDPAHRAYWNERLKGLSAVGKAAVEEYAGEIRKGKYSRKPPEATTAQMSDLIQSQVHGPEGAMRMNEVAAKGHLPPLQGAVIAAEQFGTGMLDRDSLAMLLGGGVLGGFGGKLGKAAVAYGFGGMMGKSAYDDMQNQNPGAAVFHLGVGVSAIAGHVIAEKKAAARELAAKTAKPDAPKPSALAKAAEKDPLLQRDTGVNPAAVEPEPVLEKRAKRGGVKTPKSVVETPQPAVVEPPAVKPKAKTAKKAVTPPAPEPAALQPFSEWVDSQPQGQIYTKSADLFKAWKAEHPKTTKAEFGQMMRELAVSPDHEIVTPSGNVKESGIFTFKDDTGIPRRVVGVRPAVPSVEVPEQPSADVSRETPNILDSVKPSSNIREGPNFEASKKLVRETGTPGVAIEPLITSVGEFPTIPHVVERDSSGKPVGIMQMHTPSDDPSSKVVEYISITTKPGTTGVGERLVQHAISQGYDLTSKLGENMFTRSGAKFVNRLISKQKRFSALEDENAKAPETAKPDSNTTTTIPQNVPEADNVPAPEAGTPGKTKKAKTSGKPADVAAGAYDPRGRYPAYRSDVGRATNMALKAGLKFRDEAHFEGFAEKIDAALAQPKAQHGKLITDTVNQELADQRMASARASAMSPKDVQIVEKGPQQLETFNPLRAVIGDDAYEALNEKARDIYLGTKATISPGSMSVDAKENALIGRDHIAQMAKASVQRDHDLAKVRHAFDGIVARTPGQAVRFMFDMEGGNVHADPAAQSYGNVFRQMLDDKRTEVQNLGTGALKKFITDYFPHIWKDPQKAAAVFGEGKRPLRGSKSFTMKRTIPTIEQGMFPNGTPANLDTMSMAEIKAEVAKQGGLEPLSYNPAEQVQMKLQQQDRFIFGQNWFKEMQDRGLAQFIRNNVKRPAGYVKIQDEIATWRDDGNWYAPEGAARIINNYVSPGLANHPTMGPAYRAIRSGANMLVQSKLGWSGFHWTGESINAMLSGGAKATQDVFRGDFKGAAKSAGTAATVVGTPIKYYVDGAKLYAEYLNPGSQGPKHAELLDYLTKGGGRAEMPQEFRVGAIEGFQKALRQQNVRGAVLTAFPAAMESIMAPLMRNAVPRLKLGAFTDMMSAEIDHLGPNATVMEQRAAASRVWDAVEDRFGELTYDNLFWDNTFKDIVHLTTMAPGWNLGSARTLGGAVTDVATTKSRMAAGGSRVSERTAFGASLLVGTAYLGYIYNKLHGNDPKSLEDLFTPIGPGGKRVQLPTYMRDVHGILTDPLTTIGNKRHPILSIVGETLSGKDYFGRPIRKDGGQYMRYLGKQIIPISMSGRGDDSITENIRKVFTTQQGAEKEMGIVPVSRRNKVGIRP